MLSFQCGKIRQILWPAYCSLVSDQGLLTKDEDRNAVHCRGNFRGKGLVSVYATDACQQIDSTRTDLALQEVAARCPG